MFLVAFSLDLKNKVYKFSKNIFRTPSFKVIIILLLHVITALGTICSTQNCTSLKSAAQTALVSSATNHKITKQSILSKQSSFKHSVFYWGSVKKTLLRD